MAQNTITLSETPSIADIDTIIIDNLEFLNSAKNMLQIHIPFDESIIKNPDLGFKYTDDQCDVLKPIMTQIRSHLRFENKRIMKTASKLVAKVMISGGMIVDNHTTISIIIKSNRSKIIY